MFREFTEISEIKKSENLEGKTVNQPDEMDFFMRSINRARNTTPEQLRLEAEEWKEKNPDRVKALKEALLNG